MKRAVDLMLDSGAFSAWRQHKTLDVDQYIRFCDRYHRYLESVVNLDVIPGEWGRIPSVQEINGTAALGYANLKKMVAADFHPIPVYHQGEARYWLEKFIGEGFDYIGISPGNDRTTKQKIAWLDDVFDYLCGGRGYTRIKTHGFGVTALPLMYRYPWYSLDSATWLLVGAYGQILIPLPDGRGDYDYTRAPCFVVVSERTDGKPSKVALQPGRHLRSNGATSQQYIIDYLANEGFDMEALKHDYAMRIQVNARFFVHLANRYAPKPFHRRTHALVVDSDKRPSREGVSKYPWDRLRVIFTVSSARETSQVLTAEGIRERLLSYYMFCEHEPFSIKQYVKTGVPRPKGRKRVKV